MLIKIKLISKINIDRERNRERGVIFNNVHVLREKEKGRERNGEREGGRKGDTESEREREGCSM